MDEEITINPENPEDGEPDEDTPLIPKDEPKPVNPQNRPVFGMCMAVASGVIFAIGSLTVVLLPNINPYEIYTFRSLILTVVFGLVVLLFYRDKWRGDPEESGPLWTKAFLVFVSESVAFIVFHMIPLSDASTVIFSAPVFAQFITYMGQASEKMTFFSAKSMIMKGAVAGVGLVSKPSFLFGGDMDWNQLEGVGLALISSLAMAVMYMQMDKLNKTEPVVVIFWSSAVSLFCSVIILLIIDKMTLPTTYEWYLIAGNSVAGIFGQLSLALALFYEDAGPVTLGRTVNILAALVLQVQIVREPLSWTSIGGAALVGGCVAFSVIRETNPELEKMIGEKVGGLIGGMHKDEDGETEGEGTATGDAEAGGKKSFKSAANLVKNLGLF